MSLSAGDRLGPYEILAPLGAGGMGEVYRARDARLGREVAIKVISAHIAGDPQSLRRFEKEARSVAALSHPNILAIHDFNTDNGISYVVMELLKGETLQARLAREQIPQRKAVEIAAAVADGLASAHAGGIIHRDLKPANIFLTSDGLVKILDFGLAKQDDSSKSVGSSVPTESQPGAVVGTAGYMAPEQVSGRAVDGRADIFALGCVLYEMISGKRAFVRDSSAETFAAILRDSPPELPASPVVPIVGRCLQKSPEERFQSARDLAFALRGLTAAPALRVSKIVWVAALCMLVAVAAIMAYLRVRPAHRAILSLAVVPFVNTSHDQQTEFLAEGMTDTIINKLAELPQLKVMARSTMFRFKDRDEDPRQVGRELNVASVLTGRILQAGDRLNIELELVDVHDGRQLWGERFDRPLPEMFALQDEIAQQISQRLRLKLTGNDQKRLTRRETDDAQAYSFYVQARYNLEKRTGPSIRKAIDLFNAAIQRDPNYALGYVGLANSYALLPVYGSEPLLPSLAKAKEAVVKALSIEPDLAEAHATLGLIDQFLWQWQDAEDEFRRSIALKPNYATAHHWLAFELRILRRPDESIAEFRKAHALDPLSAIINTEMADALGENNKAAEAIDLLRQTIKQNPDFLVARISLGRLYVTMGNAEPGLGELRDSGSRDDLAWAYGRLGRRQEAMALLAQLERAQASPLSIAYVYAALGDRSNAYRWLDRAVDNHIGIGGINVGPQFDSWRSDAHFQQLLRRVNLAK